MSARDPDVAPIGPPVIDRAALELRVSGIHRMEHDPGAITIHVYSPSLRAVGHYELQDGELRREAFPSDEPSSPSPGLLSAMTADSSDPSK